MLKVPPLRHLFIIHFREELPGYLLSLLAAPMTALLVLAANRLIRC